MTNIEHNWIIRHLQEIFEKYHGKHLAIVVEKIIAIGETSLEVFKKAKQSKASGKISIIYIPTEEETVTLL